MSSVRCYQLNLDEYSHLFYSPQLLYLFSLFHEHGHKIRLVGGVVRDILLGVTPHDIDLATPATTDEMLDIIRGDSNIELVYTRAEQFGTLTLVVGTTEKKTFQITTLKQSINRQGPDVHVEFTTDWKIDAQQRDLSINSLFMDEHGIIYDYINGVDDLKHNRIRFNGSVYDRLTQNPVRILRYFRFFAHLSLDPQNHDSNVLETIEQCASSLKYVPGEKIWTELELILRGRWAGHVMRTMLERNLGPILSLPESSITMFEFENRWLQCMDDQPEPMTLLVTLFDSEDELNAFCLRTKCSSRHKQLGQFLLRYRYSIESHHPRDPLFSYKELLINAHPTQHVLLRQQVIELLKYQGYTDLLNQIKEWSIPTFPVDAWDLRQNGLMNSYHFSRFLRQLKEQWKQSDYCLSKEDLIEYGFRSGLFYS